MTGQKILGRTSEELGRALLTRFCANPDPARAHAALWLGCGSAQRALDRLFSTRQRAAGDSHAGARHPRGSCTARIFCPLLSVMITTARNSWPQTLLSRRTRRTHRTRHPEHARVRTAAGRGIERNAASLDAHCHARRSPVCLACVEGSGRWQSVRASQQLKRKWRPGLGVHRYRI